MPLPHGSRTRPRACRQTACTSRHHRGAGHSWRSAESGPARVVSGAWAPQRGQDRPAEVLRAGHAWRTPQGLLNHAAEAPAVWLRVTAQGHASNASSSGSALLRLSRRAQVLRSSCSRPSIHSQRLPGKGRGLRIEALIWLAFLRGHRGNGEGRLVTLRAKLRHPLGRAEMRLISPPLHGPQCGPCEWPGPSPRRPVLVP